MDKRTCEGNKVSDDENEQVNDMHRQIDTIIISCKLHMKKTYINREKYAVYKSQNLKQNNKRLYHS